MIAYVLPPVGVVGASLVIVAVRYGRGTAGAARRFVNGGGLHRLTVRELRHELRLARHELAGAGHYIAELERDRRELSGKRDELKAGLDKAVLRIADLEEQLRETDRLRQSNRALNAAMANVHAIRPLLLSPAADVSALPDTDQEFADHTATAWRARA